MRAFLALLLVMCVLAAVGCGSPAEDAPKTIANPQKGEGNSADGTATQGGASTAVDAQ